MGCGGQLHGAPPAASELRRRWGVSGGIACAPHSLPHLLPRTTTGPDGRAAVFTAGASHPGGCAWGGCLSGQGEASGMSAGPPGPEQSAGGSRGVGQSGGGQPAQRLRARAAARAGWEARLRASAEGGASKSGEVKVESVRGLASDAERREQALCWTTLDTDPAGVTRRPRRT